MREAKAQFSALIASAAAGEEITIAWHGIPRARLTSLPSVGKPFRVDRAWLGSMPVCAKSTRSEDLIRADREGRG